MSTSRRVVDVDLDDDENAATVALELSIGDLFVERNGREELRLWQAAPVGPATFAKRPTTVSRTSS